MKIKDLIEQLSDLDGELDVVLAGYEGGVNECSSIEAVALDRNVNSAWYYGKHEVNSDLPEKTAVLLT